MFLDASAIIAILAGEDDAASLAARLARAGRVHTSGVAIYEAAAGLARIGNISPTQALQLVSTFLTDTRAQVVPIEHKISEHAVDAFTRFGKGRHKAGLNMGDCFAYACAHHVMAPLLCKGNDFPLTDIELA